ncbi:MAG: helix-turn-helix domain-containing protein [Salinimicrobium sediminis]|uniref:Helix-turn-helix domain-containing protein n=1 Tax=Salinimicrobium sediminis TaxID=1343891 RepID=A0A285X1X1_9FLAO|nr:MULTISPECIES: helix-turn-helix domain-containing protein [Salinimicrobium]MDX1601963.1 helix-turn-helix domain-containing protein [Salinimicrobium sediminis]SOC79360.1 Helix-turn-helix domain-containing protein [Salinimicrobium sediminis]
MENIFLQGTTTDKLVDLISQDVKRQLEAFKKELTNEQANDELLTREEACQFLKINSSTLWAWTNKGKVKAYGIANRRYYKRSELMECLTVLKK